MAKSKFRPLHDRVVVKRIDAEEKTKGGIIIPDTAKEKLGDRRLRNFSPSRACALTLRRRDQTNADGRENRVIGWV